MKLLVAGAALALFTTLLLASPVAWGKDCRENTGGACVGHWRCDDGDSQKVCTDVVKSSGVECRCQRPTSRTIGDGDDRWRDWCREHREDPRCERFRDEGDHDRDRWSDDRWRGWCREHREDRRCERFRDEGDHDRDRWGDDRWREWCRHHHDDDRRCERFDRDRWNDDQWREWCRHHRDDDRRCERYRDRDEDRSQWRPDQWREWCRHHKHENGLCDRWNRD